MSFSFANPRSYRSVLSMVLALLWSLFQFNWITWTLGTLRDNYRIGAECRGDRSASFKEVFPYAWNTKWCRDHCGKKLQGLGRSASHSQWLTGAFQEEDISSRVMA